MKLLTTLIGGLLSASFLCSGCIKNIKPEEPLYFNASYSQDVNSDGIEDFVEINQKISEDSFERETKIDLNSNGVINYHRSLRRDLITGSTLDITSLKNEKEEDIPFEYKTMIPFRKFYFIDDKFLNQ
ncbi:MAG: hypothetical protein KKA65_02455 [Nanoarchaeota archaeon]|nr:hypothetical protein [Nanoarchaeota archaeon]MBU4352561.1 hypothetical protein [Nanoarchaeota archaeon]MBU4456338.1 hypothetical protein [Nanoarchaeota archaeon]MCG2719184.1 hypothetical protein [Nanoarchaeota archaeon]